MTAGVIRVADVRDPRLAEYANVAQPKALRQRGRLVAEGRFVVERLLATGRFEIESLLLSEASLSALSPVLERYAPSAPVYVCAPAALERLTGHEFHRGCLALARRPAPFRVDDVLRRARSVVVLENVANADNVGGVFRNAAAFGADAVLLGPGCADPWYRKTIRTSMGYSLELPFVAIEPPGALVPVLEQLRALDFSLLALTPGPRARELASVTIASSARLALVVGAEGDGLSAAALAACPEHVRIPMRSSVDSLNLAVASGIALYRLLGERIEAR